MVGRKGRRALGFLRPLRWKTTENVESHSFMSSASVYHALVVIFLEFFAWGLLTSPIITVLNETFPNQTFLMNGLVQGVKGFLSFLCAPLIGALSDVWGRKPFLLLTVTFTCAPIPLMKFSPWWYFALLTISGIFSVTFSIVFAYVADVTAEEDRSAAYGLVSAMFAASLVTSPAIGAYLGGYFSDEMVILLASAVALLDVLFILVAVPESLPGRSQPVLMSWEKADPFGALKKVSQDDLILMLCVATFFSYLPEAGESSSFFVYLRLVRDFSKENVAFFIALVGVLSVLGQTAILSLLMRYLGSKRTIIVGLILETIQLTIYGFCSAAWLMWVAGAIAAFGSMTYPAISAFVSSHASADQQGVAQGIITGIRGLCNGLGPAVFGLIFYLFKVDLNQTGKSGEVTPPSNLNVTASILNVTEPSLILKIMPGPPFAFGALLVMLAILVAVFIPRNPHRGGGTGSAVTTPTKRTVSVSLEEFPHSSSHIIDSDPLISHTDDEH